MKQITIILLAELFVFAACNSAKDKVVVKQVKYRELIIANLKGNIRTIEATPYKVDRME